MERWREIMAALAGENRCVFVVLLCDSVLWLSLWGGLVLCDCSTSGGLLGLWAYAAVRWTILYSLAWMLTDGKPQCALNRWVALLCLLPPSFESGRTLVDPQPHAVPLWRGGGLIPEPSTVILSTILYVVAWVWEVDFPGGGGGAKGDVKKVDARKVLTRVVTFFRPDVPHLTLAFSFLIGAVICDTFIPFYQGRVIDMLSGQHLHTSFTQEIIHLSLFSIGSMLCSGLRGSMFMVTLSRLNRRMKRNLFHSLLQQEIHFFEDNKPGELSSRLSSDVDRMGRAVALNSNALVRGLVKASLMLVLMLSLSWELAVLTCIEMPLLALIQKKYTTYSQEVKEKVQESQAKNAELAKQTIEGIRVVRSFKGEKVEVKRYNDALEEMFNIKRQKDITSAVYRLIRRMVSLGIKVLMLFYGRNLLVSGQLSIGSLLTFFLYQKPMTANMKEILYGIGETMSTVGVISKVLNYLDRKPQCKEAGELAPEKLEGRVTFQNVSFAYPSTPDKPALKSVSMELCPGKITALVGPSGGGKTSCVSLLNRLYDPQEGEILLDGQPLHHYKHKYLHQKVALVSQNPELFSGSVSYNIKYGLRDCTEEKVKEAARRAKVEAFISQLDADVGERGGSLAAGQKQCIAIARALVRQPQVIILDEATSNLDVDIQNSVTQEIMACGQTVLVVAHQLKTVEHWAHHIIFMENGRIVEQGTHQELMANKDRYHRLKEGLFS